MALYKQKGSDKWWVDFEFRGRRVRRSTGTSNQRAAQKIEAALRVAMAEDAAGIEQPRERYTFKQLADRFLAHKRLYAKKPPRFHNENVGHLLAFPGLAAKYLDEIDADVLKELIAWRRISRRQVLKGGKKQSFLLTDGSINRTLATLRHMLNLGIEWEMFDRTIKMRMLPGEREREFVLHPDQEQVYFDACPAPLYRIAKLVLLTSIRPGECWLTEWPNVHLDPQIRAPYITVPAKIAKNGKKRNVPLQETAAAFMRELWAQRQERLAAAPASRGKTKVPGQRVMDGAPILTSLDHMQAEVREKLGWSDDFVLHSLRHTALTRYGQAGMDVFALKEIAGHKDIKTTMRYVHVVPEHLDYAISKVDAMGKILPMPRRQA